MIAGSDDALILLFMCCHPALSPASQIALTLRAVGGLSTTEIARGFLVSEATMTRRITRATQTVEGSHLSFRLPTKEERRQRLRAVQHTLCLIFNEGYAATSGTNLHRVDLSSEAIRLTRMLHRLLSEDSEIGGLLALMLLTDARRPARTGRWPWSMARAGLEQVARLETDARIANDHRRHAVRVHQLESAGELGRACECYMAAAERATGLSQKRYLHAQAARLSA